MTTKPSLVRRVALVATLAFVASAPACAWLTKPEPTKENPNPEAPIETVGKAVAPLLPPPFNALLPIAIGAVVSGTTAVALSKTQPKKKAQP